MATSGGADPTTFLYNADGQLLSRTPTSSTAQDLKWDDEGNLAEVDSGSTATKYLYDADGNQLIRRDPGRTTLFAGDAEIVADTSAATSTLLGGIRTYTVGAHAVASRSSLPGGTADYLISDPRGTSTITIDTTTQQVARQQYKPYGDPRASANATAWPDSTHGFLHAAQDSATGYVDLGARKYARPFAGSSVVDPLLQASDASQLGGYAYADDNPIANSDPSGTICRRDVDGETEGYCGLGSMVGAAGGIVGGLMGGSTDEDPPPTGTLGAPDRSDNGSRPLQMKNGKIYKLDDRQIDRDPDERAAYDYVNEDLRAQGIYSEDEVDGVKYFAVMKSPVAKGGGVRARMPDLVRVTFKRGRVVGVDEWDIATREGPNASGALKVLKGKAGQKPGGVRQTRNVLRWLKKLKNPDAEARAISDQADADHVDLDSVRMVSNEPGSQIDYTKTLGSNPGRLSDTHTSVDIEEPVCPGTEAVNAPDVDAPPVRWNGDIPETDPEPIVDDPIIDFPF